MSNRTPCFTISFLSINVKPLKRLSVMLYNIYVDVRKVDLMLCPAEGEFEVSDVTCSFDAVILLFILKLCS